MRRSMGRRGNNHSGGGGNGPMITEHLQDIDMELELLKRKREMIEQQQQLLVMEQQFKTSRHSLDQMRYDEPGSNRDYTHMYGSGPKHGNQFGRKRQAENQWQYDSGPKRAPPKRKSQFNQNGSGNFRNPKSGGGKPAPLMDIKVKPSIGQRIANQKGPQKAPKKDFAPSKVAKPKAPPAKSASLPVAERKKLVTAAKGSSSNGDMSRMLMPYRVPSQQVSGRLELALGAIMKNIKGYIETNKPEQADILRTHQLQRVMKQTVRERIRTVMLGKVVGSLVEILAIYREEFPEETDADVVNIALEAGGVSAPDEKAQPKFIESAEPSDFFKNNMIKLVETRLTEMFTKLEDIYSSKAPTTEDTAEEVTENATENVTEEVTEKATEEATEKATEEATEKPTEEATEKPTEEATEKATEEATGKATEEATGKATEEVTGKATEEATGKATEQLVDLQKPAEPKEDQNEYKEFLNTTIKVFEVKRILPRLIKKYIPYVVKLLNVDAMYQNTQAAITMKTNEKAARKASIKKPDESQDDDKTTVTELRAEGRYNLPYYVKIMGRPNLPKKKAMQTFLNQFNPKSIKKHRAIHNLLFVGFTEKDDFDVMVAADGTVLGKSTLSIRICNKTGPGGKEENDESNNVNQESIKEPQNDEEIVGADLDGQITDLLSAIRKSEEEEDTAQKENGDQTENKDGEENVTEQAEGNNDVMDEGMGDGNNDEDMNENAGNEEENENAATDEVETQNSEAANESEAQDTEAANEFNKSETIDISDDSKDGNTQEGDIEMGDKTSETSEPTKTGAAGATGRSTPSRMSTRLANVTPSTIRTRRASRLAPQN